MNCNEIQNQLDDYIDACLLLNENMVIKQHIHTCTSCQTALTEAEALREALSSLPLVEASDDFKSRVFENVRKQNAPQKHNRFVTGFVSAVAASMFLWLAAPLFFAPQQSVGPTNVISVAMNEIRPVKLIFDAPEDLKQVAISIELPANIELSGYTGHKQLSWNTSLKKGENVLSLPVNAIASGKGELVAHLSYGDKQKTYRLILKTTDNGVMTYQLQQSTSV